MTRTTGATDAQLTEAARRAYDSLNIHEQAETSGPAGTRRIYEVMAPWLVTTEERIVRVDDLRALVQSVDRGRMPWSVTEAIDRIQAAIGEAE